MWNLCVHSRHVQRIHQTFNKSLHLKFDTLHSAYHIFHKGAVIRLHTLKLRSHPAQTGCMNSGFLSNLINCCPILLPHRKSLPDSSLSTWMHLLVRCRKYTADNPIHGVALCPCHTPAMTSTAFSSMPWSWSSSSMEDSLEDSTKSSSTWAARRSAPSPLKWPERVASGWNCFLRIWCRTSCICRNG